MRRLAVLRDWVQAVQRHVPGESDAALLSVAAWSRDDVQAAWIDVQAFLALVKDERANQFFVQPTGQRRVFRSFMNNADLDALRQLASKLRSAIEIFLKRAAVLHSDVAYEFEINREMPALPSMLSPQRFVVETNDGQQEGVKSGIVHWEFGQLLLDHIPNAQRDDFVRC